MNDFLSKTPQIARCQIVQVKPVESMNVNASNALLKTLEEPAGESYLMLMSERLGAVLPTIRSRTQKTVLQPPRDDVGIKWVQEATSGAFSDAEIANALRQNGNAPLKATEWLRDGKAGQSELFFTQMKNWLSGATGLQDVSSALSKSELQALLEWWLSLSLDVVKSGMECRQHLVFSNEAEWISTLSATVNRVKLLTLQARLQELAGKAASGQMNPNQSLLTESLLLDWRNATQ